MNIPLSQKRLSSLLMLAFGTTLIVTSGCLVTSVHPVEQEVIVPARVEAGPPPWAPARGYRHKVQYRYYYDREVYYNLDRREYVWLDGGSWHVGVTLPRAIVIRPDYDSYALIDLDGDEPQIYHEQVKVYVNDYKKGHGRGPDDRGRGNQGRGRGRGR